MNYYKKIKEYWLISAIMVCGIVFGTTWMLSVNPMVDPRNFETEKSRDENTKPESEIEKLPSQPASSVNTENKPDNEETSLMQGTSFTSKFGFMVYISNSDNDLKQASMYITLDNNKNKNKNHKNVGIGEKIKINHADTNYSIEINDIRDNWVDLVIRKNV